VQVENEIYVLNEDLEDMGTSLIGLAETVATEEHHMVGNDVLPTNPALPSPNSALFNRWSPRQRDYSHFGRGKH
jgi:hypothetical protein